MAFADLLRLLLFLTLALVAQALPTAHNLGQLLGTRAYSHSAESISSGAIAGATIGGIVGIALFILIVIIIINKNKK